MARKFEDWLDAAYQAGGDRQTLDRVYDDWAREYDQDLWASGNPYTAVMAGMAGRYIPARDARILDGGCGTGNMGELLHLLGYGNIVGIDASDGMLAVARAKSCYAAVHKMLLGAKIDLPAESFDAVTAAGVLTHGHAPPQSLDGLLGLAKPGAPIIFSISKVAMEEDGFGEKIAELDRAGAWTLEERTEPFRTYPFSPDYADLHHWINVYRKAGAG
jgi:2-polyprenyl-3-methyl-5-hydroxy-6-metoxy-1,4-benzoquinol methylase